MARLNSVFGLLLLILLPLEIASQFCSRSSDVGSVECVLINIPAYDDYQWATCLTDDYIMLASGEKHACISGPGTTCWYQCMLELYQREDGAVTSDCRCSASDPGLADRLLPPECYSPSGDDCTWYRECLEERYSCEGTKDGYAIEYAEKFCKLYSSNYDDFTDTGRIWIDATRKCLQVALVPSLRPWLTKTCKEIQEGAFTSHSPCYLSPSPEAPSVCDLPCIDLMRMFWLVSFDGGALTSAPLQTGQQMLEVLAGCSRKDEFFSGCLPDFQVSVRITVPEIPPIEPLETVGQVVDYIADKLNWINDDFGYFPFFNDFGYDTSNKKGSSIRQSTQVSSEINLLLADLYALGIADGPHPPEQGNLDEAVMNLADAVRNGELSNIPVDLNGTEITLGVTSVGLCQDNYCNSSNVTILGEAPTSGAVLLEQVHYLTIFIGFLLFVLIAWI